MDFVCGCQSLRSREWQDFRMYKLRCLWNPDDYIIPAVYDSSVKSTLDSIKIYMNHDTLLSCLK